VAGDFRKKSGKNPEKLVFLQKIASEAIKKSDMRSSLFIRSNLAFCPASTES